MALPSEPHIQADVIYGRKDGMALTFDFLRPCRPNGAGIIFIQSGGWYSVWKEPRTSLRACQPLLDRGFAIFIVYHGSAPRYLIPDAVADVRRAVRYIRLRAGEFGIASTKLGALGTSAGGHLALMLATTGDDGDVNSDDEVLRQASRISAAVSLFAPTDLRDWVRNPPEAIRKILGENSPLNISAEQAVQVSPLLHISASTVPICLIHGDHDDLVPLVHSQKFDAQMRLHNRVGHFLIVEGANHVFTANDHAIAAPTMAKWFERHLADEAISSTES